MPAGPDSAISLTRLRLCGAAGVILLVVGVIVNEWVLARVVSDDGEMAPLTVARVRLIQACLVGAGLMLVAFRRLFARVGWPLHLVREHPRAVALATGVVLAGAAWLAAEAALHVLNQRRPSPVYDVRVTSLDGSPTTDSMAVGDDLLGYRMTPERRTRMRVTSGERVVYDIVNETDVFGRRVTPVDDPGGRIQYGLFFGCSFTWGQGVDDHETMPAAVGRLAASVRPYNYAYRGYGPQQTHELLRAVDLGAQIPETTGFAVYTAMSDHLRRAIGAMTTAASARRGFPYFTLDDDGRAIRRGTFENGRPYRQIAYDLLSRSEVLRFFHVDFPLALSETDFELVAALLAQARDAYRERFGNDRFYVLLYPGATTLAPLRPKLETRGVSVLDYTGLFDGETRPLTIAGDGHPTALAHELVANRLVSDLGVGTPARNDR